MKKIPLIIDTDPGHDDAAAIAMAYGSGMFDIRGITCVPGNNLLHKVVKNALQIVEFMGADIPVFAGCPKPLCQPCSPAEWVHGESGMEGPHLPLPKRKAEDKNAIDFMAEQIVACKGELVLAPIGPMTNIAALLLAYPELKPQIKRIVLMGGGAGTGNVTAAAEFNIWHDPEAAAVVFQSGVPITMCGLDITHRMVIEPDEVEQLRAGSKTGRIMAELFDYYQAYHSLEGKQHVIPHDACTIAWLMDPEMFDTRKMYVEVDTTNGVSRGCTATYISDRGFGSKDPNTDVVFDGDREKFVKMFSDAVHAIG